MRCTYGDLFAKEAPEVFAQRSWVDIVTLTFNDRESSAGDFFGELAGSPLEEVRGAAAR